MDIFLSYAREDIQKAQMLAFAFKAKGWSVFWDRTSLLAGQDFEPVIEEAIKQAGCMVVGWSQAAKQSDWVRGEANIGRERHILVPVLFETVEPPIAFRSLHTLDLSAWEGNAEAPEFLMLCHAIEAILSKNSLSMRYHHGSYQRKDSGVQLSKSTAKFWWLRKCWSWLAVDKNQKTLTFIGTGLVILCGGLWQGYLHFSEINDENKPLINTYNNYRDYKDDQNTVTMSNENVSIIQNQGDNNNINITKQESKNVEIGKNEGIVYANYYLPNNQKPKFRVYYYLMGGVAPNFLINGQLHPRWRKHLGDNAPIIPNPVLKEAKQFLDKFSSKLDVSTLNDIDDIQSSTTILGYAEESGVNPKQLKAYLQGQESTISFVDAKAIKTLLKTNQWSEDYKIDSREMDLSKSAIIDTPTIWRYLTGYDLIKKPFTGFDFIMYPNDKVKYMNSLKYLANYGGIPPGFMTIRMQLSSVGCDANEYFFDFESDTRHFELLIAVVENVGQETIKIGKIGYKETVENRLRQPSETDKNLALAETKREALFVSEQLRPNEKFIIPLRIQLVNSSNAESSGTTINQQDQPKDEISMNNRISNQPNTYEPQLSINQAHTNQVTDHTSKKNDNTIRINWIPKDFWENKLPTIKFPKIYTDKLRSAIPEPEKPLTIDRFEFGPSWQLVDIEVEETTLPFRKYDPNKIVLVGGFEYGSCPFLYRYVKQSDTWINEGAILVGASKITAKRSEEKELKNFNGIIRISELEPETSYLDEVHLRIVNAQNQEQIFRPQNHLLQQLDGKEVVLNQGQSVTIDFTKYQKQWSNKKLFLSVSGYYVPWRTKQKINTK